MDPIDVLAKEHQLIERMLSVLDVLVSAAEAGTTVDRDALGRCVTFFREYVDLGHHEKEETILFPVLSECGFDWSAGPLARIRKEHDQERYLVRSLRHATRQKAEWTTEDARHFASIGREFLELQRQHLVHENTDLFPLVKKRLPKDRADAVLRSFATLDGEHSDMDELVSSAQELYARFRG